MSNDSNGGCVTTLPPAHHPWSDELEYDIAHFTLGGLYLQLLCLSIYNRLRRVNEKRRLWQQTFFVALVLVRGTWAFCQPFVSEGMMTMPNTVNLILQTLPSFLFFSCYLIIIFLWAEIYHNMFAPGVNIYKLKPIYFATQGPLVVIGLEVVDMLVNSISQVCLKPDVVASPFQTAVWCLDASLYILTAFGFIIYGGRFYLRFSQERKPLLVEMKQSVLPKVKAMALGLSITFIVRGGFTFSNAFSNWTNNLWFIDLLYFSVLEVVPIVLMLLILRPATQHGHDPVINSPVSSVTEVVHD